MGAMVETEPNAHSIIMFNCKHCIQRSGISMVTWYTDSSSMDSSPKDSLKIILKTYKNHFRSYMNNFFSKDQSVTVHDPNLQIPATKIYKKLNSLSSEIMKDAFKKLTTIILF